MTPFQIKLQKAENKRFKLVFAGVHSSFATTEDGLLYGWGDNKNGQVSSICLFVHSLFINLFVCLCMYLFISRFFLAGNWNNKKCSTALLSTVG
jgi:hypothetical protein